MTLYSFVLFLHVVSAMGFFVALALEGFVSIRIRFAQDTEQLRFFVRTFEALRWVFIPSFAGMLLGGLYLASAYGRGTFWIPAALIATLAVMLIGGLITGRRMNQLKKALGKPEETFNALTARAKDELVVHSYGLRAGLALGIVFLMSAKPGLRLSVWALVAGCAAGLFIGSSIGKISNRSGVCSGPGRNRSFRNAPTASAR
jgi:outer membrane lipoprotein SlyB